MNLFLLRFGKMSLQAAMAVCVVFLIRLVFDRARFPKKYSCFLWLVPYLVMILPWRVRTSFGFWQGGPEEYVPVRMPGRRILASGGTYMISDYKDPVFPARAHGAGDQTVSFTLLFLCIWLCGIVVLLLRNRILYRRLRRSLICSVQVEDHIYVTDDLVSPLVLGIRSPAIYLPSRMEKDLRTCVIAHERMHIRRRDPLVKMTAFLITCIHWFNPAAWAALCGLEQDMEMACDEGAVEFLGKGQAHHYAETLLKVSAGPEIPTGSLLAFGNVSVRKRIENILERKRSFRAAAIPGMTAVLLLFAGFLTEARELPGSRYIVDSLENIFWELPADAGQAGTSGQDAAVEEDAGWYREGYVEPELHLYVPRSAMDSGYVTAGLRSEGQLEPLARFAMRELYDLTGTQIGECCYFAYDHNYFVFGLTEEDLERGRSFYGRQFPNETIIPGIDMASARRVWYSPVDMMSPPDGYENMTEADIFSNIAGPYPDSHIQH